MAKSKQMEGDTTEEGEKLTPEMAKRKAAAISQSRILTQEDLKLIRAKQISKEMEKAAPKGKGKKRKHVQIEDRDTSSELPSLSDIERIHKKPRTDKESRLATVQAGREGREKFGSKKQRKKNQRSGTTNKEKQKNKAFMMMKQKRQVRGKGKRSFRDKQEPRAFGARGPLKQCDEPPHSKSWLRA
ncbi:Protein SDA1 [Branchiostoma belcheri]|nr:Protein SDA1 [Branchiostoma belcheri]